MKTKNNILQAIRNNEKYLEENELDGEEIKEIEDRIITLAWVLGEKE